MGLEQDATGNGFHFAQDASQLALVVYRFFHLLKLLRSQGYGNGLAGHFTGPLVARAAAGAAVASWATSASATGSASGEQEG